MMEYFGDTRKRKFRCYSPNCRGKEVSKASFYKHKKRRKILEDANGSQEVIACEEWPDDSVAAEEVAIEEVDDFGFANGKILAPADRDSTLESAMRTQMVLLQSDLDIAKVPMDLQEKIMRRVFSEKSTSCFDSMSIGQLFSYAGNQSSFEFITFNTFILIHLIQYIYKDMIYFPKLLRFLYFCGRINRRGNEYSNLIRSTIEGL